MKKRENTKIEENEIQTQDLIYTLWTNSSIKWVIMFI